MNKKSFVEIFAHVSKIVNIGAVKTQIIRKSNQNFKIVEKYLEQKQLISAGLIVGPVGLGNNSVITDKGIKKILQFESLNRCLEKPLEPRILNGWKSLSTDVIPIFAGATFGVVVFILIRVWSNILLKVQKR